MSQTPEQWSQDPPIEGLFDLGRELEAGPEGTRRRLEEKERVLASAGVIFPSTDGWSDRELALLMTAGVCIPDDGPHNYGDSLVKPSGSTDGFTGRRRGATRGRGI